MSISSVGLDQSIGSSSGRSAVRHANQDFDQLFQSLQAGNLNAAQQAYNSFQQIQTGLAGSTAVPSSSVAAASPANPIAADWSALGQALQSGSLTSAQTALSQLQQDAQTVWQAHLQQQAQNAQSVYALLQGNQGVTTTSGVTSASAPTTAGSVQNDLSALTQALQSGDTSAAQKLLAQLEQDLQSSGQLSGQNYGRHHHHHHGGFSGLNSLTATSSTSATTTTPVTAASPASTASTSTPSGGGTGIAA